MSCRVWYHHFSLLCWSKPKAITYLLIQSSTQHDNLIRWSLPQIESQWTVSVVSNKDVIRRIRIRRSIGDRWKAFVCRRWRYPYNVNEWEFSTTAEKCFRFTARDAINFYDRFISWNFFSPCFLKNKILNDANETCKVVFIRIIWLLSM